ncbi:hypothetical protein AUEXF2481DRAFT_37426 [Aureobasidium subglaciale EXF-2481]|uniref:Uncharacterized protein n=1 Tax=Aureobasidium subglaciale (strain EXF-2481) TaxID=1043005 RepID=A0A074ZH33_AURSE|nr:uncharacterized protein AUEXF2481DRAFT_37426 [Aureobasidium subglaciale EXF-2481]KEQ97866.1 hypothetical protein AUEXF2481DRAFT_37426 [Aureobasidium subglaciale EXF-2481]
MRDIPWLSQRAHVRITCSTPVMQVYTANVTCQIRHQVIKRRVPNIPIPGPTRMVGVTMQPDQPLPSALDSELASYVWTWN